VFDRLLEHRADAQAFDQVIRRLSSPAPGLRQRVSPGTEKLAAPCGTDANLVARLEKAAGRGTKGIPNISHEKLAAACEARATELVKQRHVVEKLAFILVGLEAQEEAMRRRA
jgi:hypothetical protein